MGARFTCFSGAWGATGPLGKGEWFSSTEEASSRVSFQE